MIRARRLILYWGLVLVLCGMAVGSPMTARAASETESSSAEGGVNEAFKWINFAVLAGVIAYFVAKSSPSFFRKRADQIGSAIAQAGAARAEADRQLQEAESRLARLEEEVAELRAAARRDAAAEADRIRAAAKKEVEKIAIAAKAEIEAAERAARLELKALAAKLAVDGAESLLARQLTPQAQAALVRAFVQKLAHDGRPN